MKFVLEIDMGNAAFAIDAEYEVARILRIAAQKAEDHPVRSVVEFKLYDINGNHVGKGAYRATPRSKKKEIE